MATYPQYDSYAPQVTKEEYESSSVGNATDQTLPNGAPKEEPTSAATNSAPQGDPEAVTQRRRLRIVPSNINSRVQKLQEFAGRHVTMMALGNIARLNLLTLTGSAVGTGLLYQSGEALHLSGPVSLWVAYLLMGSVLYAVMV